MRLGLMDQLYPMQYFRGDNYYPFVADWVENAYKREIVTGLGTYFLDPREVLMLWATSPARCM